MPASSTAGARARFGSPLPARAIPRFARVRNIWRANLNPALAVKNLLDDSALSRYCSIHLRSLCAWFSYIAILKSGISRDRKKAEYILPNLSLPDVD
jgi:hypothetical protein